ncbi:hypothetical protein GOA97_01935 [Sinorhizobium meliloti]|nr:hypothetical protein [Sinorhizobium meliloti]MDW9653268.1 hypothetical protein [Sinorhizobium meliloti]MDW9913232.1 hypothetical protein [Sinorhizobium meliloti]MDW9940070.1 hypothetical protein [Sinorhizobium meliloti]MDW9944334.1 hypothetical protein [Sinorhizobium meliloti]
MEGEQQTTDKPSDQHTEGDDGGEDLQDLEDLEDLEGLDVETLQAKTNAALDEFRESHTEAQQTFIAEAFIDTGEIPTGEAFGITEHQARVVEAGFIRSMERDVFSQYGLTHEHWMEHVDDRDLPTFRRAAIKGDWSVFHQHAEQCAKLRKELGI